MTIKGEDVNDAFPYRRAFECLFDWERLDKRCRAAMRVLDRFAKLVCFNLDHGLSRQMSQFDL
jgi:hypothetical protein